MPECGIKTLGSLQARKRNLESVVPELGYTHSGELFLRLGELSKIGDIINTYTTT